MNRPTGPMKRLHHATLWLPFLESILSLIVPVVVLSVVLSPEEALTIAGLYIALPSCGFFVLRYFTTRYFHNPTELVIRSGILFRKERRIPLERIQDLNIHQTIIRRWMGLASLKLTTAGAETEEAKLDVLSIGEADRMRLEIASFHTTDSTEKNDGIPEAPPLQETLCQLGWRELAIGGLTSNLVAGLGAVLGAFLYLNYFQAWDIGKYDGYFEKMIERQASKIESVLPMGHFVVRIIDFFFLSGSFGKALLFAIVGACGSIVSFVVRYHGFRLTRTKTVTSRIYGLFTLRRTSLPQSRIQAIKIDEGFLRRCFGLAAIRADTAGDRKEIDENNKRDLLVPVATCGQAQEIVLNLQPDLSPSPWDWRHVSRQSIMRRSRIGWAIVFIGVVQTALWASWLALVWLPAPFIVYYWNLQWYRNTKYCLTSQYVLWRTGWLNRSTLFLPIKNIQNVTLMQNPFDRRLKLASLVIDTAGQSNTGGGPVIRHLPINDAIDLKKIIIDRVVRTRFGW